MKTIITIHDKDIDPLTESVDRSQFVVREAARAVLIDQDGKVALLQVGKHKYHKLPGGGIDTGEDVYRALMREINEEVRCKAQIVDELGITVEFRDKFNQKQISYCYRATLDGMPGTPKFTEEERLDQFSVVWAENLSEAIRLLELDAPDDYQGKYIKKRDIAILNQAKQVERSRVNTQTNENQQKGV